MFAIFVISATAVGSEIADGDLSLALDGNFGAGYVVTNNNTSAQGFNIRFDFDVSDYLSVDEFIFHLQGSTLSIMQHFNEFFLARAHIQISPLLIRRSISW